MTSATSLLGTRDMDRTSGYAQLLPLDEESDFSDEDVNMENHTTFSTHATPIIQFASTLNFCVEDEPAVAVDVIRLGDPDVTSEVSWTTQDASAKSGLVYHQRSGRLKFLPGQRLQTITVNLIQNDRWDPDLDFFIKLLPDEMENCKLNRNLSSTRVKIIDDDAFPTNKYRESLQAGKFDDIPSFSLVVEYTKMNFQNHELQRNCKCVLLSITVHQVLFFLKMLANTWLLDDVLNPKDKLLFGLDKRHLFVGLISCGVACYGLLHFLDYKQYDWPIAGQAERNLKVALLRKFLSYDDVSRAKVDAGQLITSLTRDCTEVVLGGFMGTFALFRALGTFLSVILYELAAPVIFNKPFRALAFCPLAIIPVFLMTAFRMRYPTTQKWLSSAYEQEASLVDYVAQVVSNFRLVSDYRRRGRSADLYEERIKKYRSTRGELNRVLENNHHIAPWVGVVFVSIYLLFGGMQVIEGQLSIGLFVTDVHILMHVASACGLVYQVVEEVAIVIPLLRRIVMFMNLTTDTQKRMRLSRHHQWMTKVYLDEIIADNARSPSTNSTGDVIDQLPIHMRSVPLQTQVGLNIGIKFNQGQLVALIGPSGHGKSMILKLVSGAALPALRLADKTFVHFVPTHLRVLNVAAEFLFYKRDLLYNLTYGVESADNLDGQLERVIKICQSLTLPPHILKYIETGAVHEWSQILSPTQKQLLNLARAFVSNHELICIHKPTELLDRQQAKIIFNLLREFVNKRGIAQDSSSRWSTSRPRTCIFTSSKQYGLRMADRAYLVTRERGVEPLAHLKARMIRDL